MAEAIQNHFPTSIYAALLHKDWKDLNAELLKEAYQIRDHDEAGREWSKDAYPAGFTSYGGMDQLHRFSSTFMALERHLHRHAKKFAKALGFQNDVVMSDCWLNIMGRYCSHGSHIHPNSILSGTYYVQTPKNCPGLKVEDPRLPFMMAIGPTDTPRHITLPAHAGHLILFESWLRHEVPPHNHDEERVSISFNFFWR
jgi:uncharacterized protein (TIGR02466 family)